LKIILSRLALASFALHSYDASAVTVRGGMGVGSFQDIQVPYHEQYEVRGDGTAAQEENVDHAGLLLEAGIGKQTGSGSWIWQIFDFDALQIKSSGGPAATQASSYSRLNLQSGLSYRFAVTDLIGATGLTAGVRRSSFNNVSSAHYIESVLIGLKGGLTGHSHALQGSFAVAPMARFGYSEDGMFGGRRFEKSKASLYEATLQYSYLLQQDVWLDLGAAQESAHVEIEDVNEYNALGYGLSVRDTARPNRVYDLSTVAIRLGFRKAF
jgi:hypothetical protein